MTGHRQEKHNAELVLGDRMMSHNSANRYHSVKLLRHSLVYQTKEFFNNSTLHGVRYIAESDRPFGERFMWFCFTSIGFVSAFVIILSLWEKFQTNPTITGLDTDFHNQKVIFPTVAVCPASPFNPDKVKEVAYNELGELEPDSTKFEPVLEALTILSYETMGSAYAISQSTSRERSYEKKSLRSLMFLVMANCDEIFTSCRYRDEELDCCEKFIPIYTEHGLCYAFNTKYVETADKIEENTQLLDLFETDKKWALSFALNKKSKIFLHSYVEETGWDFHPQLQWDVNQTSDLLISMKQTYTTDDARQLTIGQRKCIFPDEGKLQYSKDEDYTFTSCMKECRIKKCLKLCSCVPPFYKPIRNQPYCNIRQLKCLAEFAKNITNIKDCMQCELSCQNTVYEIEKLTKSALDTGAKDEAIVDIEFLTWPIIRYKREVLFGWVDLLVSFGGIAGLFLGFSLLSGVEIIYYFTIRACCMVYKDRAELEQIEIEKASHIQKRFNLALKPTFGELRKRSIAPIGAAMHTPSMKQKISVNVINLIPVKKSTKPAFTIVKAFNGVGIGDGGGSGGIIDAGDDRSGRNTRQIQTRYDSIYQYNYIP